MGKVLAIDYGRKRTGLALSDEMQIFAFGHGTVESHLLKNYLLQLHQKEKFTEIVLGEPKRLNNEVSETTEMVYRFEKELQTWFPTLKIQLIDERFTSKMAQASILQSGLKKKDRQNKALIDTVSATIILQSYLEMKSI
jgi:putative Holliday junction resolvase